MPVPAGARAVGMTPRRAMSAYAPAARRISGADGLSGGGKTPANAAALFSHEE